ncbi:Immunoglobulin-like fold [Phytophthora cactorum]|nr:Immunoglobulin-like fold [Phytophthora cactorum]
MEAPSEDDASSSLTTPSASTRETTSPNATLPTPNFPVQASQPPSKESPDVLPDAPATKQTTRSLLALQLEREMLKRRPDHFVIGVTCRSLGGVPSNLRSQVWQELLGVARTERLSLDQSILQVEEDLDNQRVIAADAARTRGNEPRFKQPETVELVVKLLTYYCKWMNEVLAPFLLLTEQRDGAQERTPLAEGVVFQCFYALIDRFLPHVFVDKEFRSLQCSFQLYRLLMLYHDPELCHYLDQHDMTPELYVTPWFMTLFARSLPPEFVFYLWDFFLLEEDPYLLHFVAYALVAASREKVFEADIAMLPQVLSSLTFSSRDELERVCADALAISELTPKSFKRDLYSVCYGGLTDAMVPFLDQLYACSSLQVYPEELVRNLMDRLATKAKENRIPVPSGMQEEDTSVQDPLNPLFSPASDEAPLLYSSGNDGDEAAALKFIVLDCRSVEEYHKSHLSLSHHIDPGIMGRPDALDGLMKGFSHMKGCHFCFVGPSVDSPSVLPRSSSNNAALNPIVRLARVISNDKSVLEQSHKPIDVQVGPEVTGAVPPSSSPPTGPVTLSRKQSPGEPGALASEIGSIGASKVHAEHESVTRLVLMFLQKGFKYVSHLRGFDELEKSIRAMDTFAQEQLLVSSPMPLLITEQIPVPPETGNDFVTEIDTSTRSEVSDTSSGRSTTITLSTSTSASSAPSSSSKEVKEVQKKTKITASSAVSTLSQRLMLLKAAARDAVSSTSSSIGLSSSNTSAEANDVVDESHSASEDGWVEVRVKTSDTVEKSAGQTTDVELQPGPIGILFQKSRTSKIFQAVVDSVVPDSQASATGLINTGDLLVAINGESLEDVAFLTVIERVIEASRPVMLRFLTPVSSQRDKAATVSDIPPLAPTLVSATRHSICITWDKLPASVASPAVARYQLQFAKQSGDEFNPWLPVAMKQEGTTAEVDSTGITDQTNGTMVGLEPGESLVFRVRCGDGQQWSGAVTPTSVSHEDLTTAVFLPGVCPEYVERGRFFYRVLLALQARRRPDFNAEKLDVILEKGIVIRGTERLVCPERMVNSCCFGMAKGRRMMTLRFLNGFLILLSKKLDLLYKNKPSLWFSPSFSSSGIAPTSLGDNVHSNSAGSISSMVSTAASSSGNSAPSSSLALVAPRILQVFAASSSEVVVTWDPVNDVGVTKYQIQYVKDRLAAMWWTVKPDIEADTLKNSWSPYSESSESCRTLPTGKVSANSSSDEDEKDLIHAATFKQQWKKPQSMTPAPQTSRLRRRSNSSNNHQVETQPDETSLSKEDDEHDDDRKSEPSSRYVNLASWKSSSNNADKDFHFYHATRFEEQDEEAHRQLSNLGMGAGYHIFGACRARCEGGDARGVEERNDLDNSLVFHFKEQIEVTPDSAERSDQIIVVVDEAKACAKVVQEYHAKVNVEG